MSRAGPSVEFAKQAGFKPTGYLAQWVSVFFPPAPRETHLMMVCVRWVVGVVSSATALPRAAAAGHQREPGLALPTCLE